MNQAAAHTLALLHRQYPFGLPRVQSEVKAVVFFSAEKLTVEGQELILNAAVKGLRLAPQDFCLEVGTRNVIAQTLIVLGALPDESYSKVPAAMSIQSHPVEQLLSDVNKKKQFWEAIKPLVKNQK